MAFRAEEGVGVRVVVAGASLINVLQGRHERAIYALVGHDVVDSYSFFAFISCSHFSLVCAARHDFVQQFGVELCFFLLLQLRLVRDAHIEDDLRLLFARSLAVILRR